MELPSESRAMSCNLLEAPCQAEMQTAHAGTGAAVAEAEVRPGALDNGCIDNSGLADDPEDGLEEIQLCHDQAEWLEEMADLHKLSQGSPPERPSCQSPSEPAPKKHLPVSRLTDGACLALQRLADTANREMPKNKRHIFLVVRCRRCLQHSRGGAKKDVLVKLSKQHWTWLQGVQARCKHASVGKTLRILIDFYMPLCKGDTAFQEMLFRPSTIRSSKSDGYLVAQAERLSADADLSPSSAEGMSLPRLGSDGELAKMSRAARLGA